jgi:Putative MetA-pathway of phenol degradation
MFQSRCTLTRRAWLLAFLLPTPAAAQTEYRSLDDDRPVATEDAYPVDRYEFELAIPYRFEAERAGVDLHSIVPELGYGLIRNGEVGVKLPLAAADNGGSTDWGPAGVRLFGLYNFNTEDQLLPAVSLRADAAIPVGSLAGDNVRFALKAIATRSWGRVRTHLNAMRAFGSEAALAVVDPLPRWRASLAVDRTLFQRSLLIIAEVVTTQLVDGGASETSLGAGGRWQWTPTCVLDLGVSRRLSHGGPDVALTLGVSHAFGLRAVLPSGLR